MQFKKQTIIFGLRQYLDFSIVEVEQVCELGRSLVMEGFVSEEEDFKLDALIVVAMIPYNKRALAE